VEEVKRYQAFWYVNQISPAARAGLIPGICGVMDVFVGMKFSFTLTLT
jgi:hypothetical protein